MKKATFSNYDCNPLATDESEKRDPVLHKQFQMDFILNHGLGKKEKFAA